ncbi:hypothetical protein WH47_03174 [Habropoda laboriosa]|uniref:Uncharacterized protein n=1 Tax=Habropoda laboriosa TaxID=597456 RepID=A0A0L7RB97_9HYME|nr:hypothetical protein WH47_03174 [Habropoda laboriosa]
MIHSSLPPLPPFPSIPCIRVILFTLAKERPFLGNLPLGIASTTNERTKRWSDVKFVYFKSNR